MKSSRFAIAIVAAAALLVMALAPAGASAKNDRSIAKRACQAERAENGREAFREAYGKNAMRKCKREARGEVANAARECRAEREEIGMEAFREKYGKNKNKRNAMGKCVSSKVRDAVDPEPDPETEAPS